MIPGHARTHGETARLGNMLPYRKAAELLAESSPLKPPKAIKQSAKRTLNIGTSLKEQSLRQEWNNPPFACEGKQLELGMPTESLREFVVGTDTAHIRSANQKTVYDFEVVRWNAQTLPEGIIRIWMSGDAKVTSRRRA